MSLRREILDDNLAVDLAVGLSEVDTARRHGVSDRTVRRRLQDPVFVARVRSARRARVERAEARGVALLDKAIDTVNEAMDAESVALRLQAARTALATPRLLHVTDHLEARVLALEALLEANERKRYDP